MEIRNAKASGAALWGSTLYVQRPLPRPKEKLPLGHRAFPQSGGERRNPAGSQGGKIQLVFRFAPCERSDLLAGQQRRGGFLYRKGKRVGG